MTIKSWKRRGEWLELMPGKVVTGSPDRQLAAEQWLLTELSFPEKLFRQLKANHGIQLAGDRLRLALLHLSPLMLNPVERLRCCTRMIFVWLYINPLV